MNTAELKANAKEQLRGKWAVAIATVLVANILIDSDVMYKVSEKFGLIGLSTLSAV